MRNKFLQTHLNYFIKFNEQNIKVKQNIKIIKF